ncbi:MAG: hypothetical protein JXA28_03525 [Bacteroidetes bacterium]|nr:hypothetical protein [Bacteroidota bacterium]
MTVFEPAFSQFFFASPGHPAATGFDFGTAATGLINMIGACKSLCLSTGEPFRWINFIGFVSGFTCIIPLIIGYRKRRSLDPGLRLLLINLQVVFLVEVISLALGLLYKHHIITIPPQYIYTLYTPVEFILFMLMFRHWHAGTRIRAALTGTVWLYLCAWLIGNGILLSQGFNAWQEDQLDMNDIYLSVQSVLFIIISIVTLLKMINDETTPVVSNPVFWVTAAILFYFTGSLFIFTFQSLILSDLTSNIILAWYLHSALNIVKYALFAVAFSTVGKMHPQFNITG